MISLRFRLLPLPSPLHTSRFFSHFGECFSEEQKRSSKAPFHVFRTDSDNIPVYIKKKNGGNKVFTWVFKVHGHKKILKEELETICRRPVIERGGWFEIPGDYKKLIKQYLAGLHM